MPDKKVVYQDRVDTLARISGLEVRHHREKKGKPWRYVNESVYEFFFAGQCVKSCFTYDKAKLFAEGVEFGKQQVYSGLHED